MPVLLYVAILFFLSAFIQLVLMRNLLIFFSVARSCGGFTMAVKSIIFSMGQVLIPFRILYSFQSQPCVLAEPIYWYLVNLQNIYE
jgi:hypothetical protein